MLGKNKNILVVDDEPKIVEVLSSFLQSKGFCVWTAENGTQAMHVFDSNNIALLILDLMLPDISGEEVCRAIRKKSRVPIMMLTAKADEESIVQGLGIGADDYIAKPFRLKELYARVEALLRRTREELIPLSVKNSWNDGDLYVDFEKNLFQKNHETVTLTPNEASILSALITYPGKVFTRAELVEAALGQDFEGYERTIDTHIKNLRQKLETDSRAPMYILTVHGIGYKFGGA